MDFWVEICKILITVVLAVFGWLIAHKLTSVRDLKNKKREIRINFLLDAYRKLERSIHKEKIGRDFVEAISDIQFLGTPPQVNMAKRIAADFAQNGQVDLDELLIDLRDSMRRELELEKIDERFIWVRIKNG
jgi:Ca2+-binding EF-hand superfamily protein